MDVSAFRHQASITINRSPDEVYDVVSDITRMGELSPVCVGGEWDDPTAARTKGARFVGHNAIGDFTWQTYCTVVTAEPGREFAFVNRGQHDGEVPLVRWGFVLEPDGDGTRVTETWEVLPGYPVYLRDEQALGDDELMARIEGMGQLARDGIPATLANLKRVVEG